MKKGTRLWIPTLNEVVVLLSEEVKYGTHLVEFSNEHVRNVPVSMLQPYPDFPGHQPGARVWWVPKPLFNGTRFSLCAGIITHRFSYANQCFHDTAYVQFYTQDVIEAHTSSSGKVIPETLGEECFTIQRTLEIPLVELVLLNDGVTYP